MHNAIECQFMGFDCHREPIVGNGFSQVLDM